MSPWHFNPPPERDTLIDLTEAEMNASELAEWDRFHATMNDRQRGLIMPRDEESYRDFHKRWLFLLRKRQSDQDRETLGLEPYRNDQLVIPPR